MNVFLVASILCGSHCALPTFWFRFPAADVPRYARLPGVLFTFFIYFSYIPMNQEICLQGPHSPDSLGLLF